MTEQGEQTQRGVSSHTDGVSSMRLFKDDHQRSFSQPPCCIALSSLRRVMALYTRSKAGPPLGLEHVRWQFVFLQMLLTELESEGLKCALGATHCYWAAPYHIVTRFFALCFSFLHQTNATYISNEHGKTKRKTEKDFG